MLRSLLTALAFFVCLALQAQQMETTITLVKQWIGSNGQTIQEESHLSGDEAQQFVWQDHVEDYKEIIILRNKALTLSDPTLTPEKYAPTIEPFKDLVQKIRVKNAEGLEAEYKWLGDDRVPAEEKKSYRVYHRTIDSDPAFHPLVYLDKKDDAYVLRWCETADCPGDLLAMGQLSVELLDWYDKARMTRSVNTILYPTPDAYSTRVVEIEVETYGK